MALDKTYKKYQNTVPYPHHVVGQTKEAARIERQRYKEEEYRMRMLFKADLLEDLGITGHPKAEKLWNLAWEEGHSEGYYSVYDNAERYAELVN